MGEGIEASKQGEEGSKMTTIDDITPQISPTGSSGSHSARLDVGNGCQTTLAHYPPPLLLTQPPKNPPAYVPSFSKYVNSHGSIVESVDPLPQQGSTRRRGRRGRRGRGQIGEGFGAGTKVSKFPHTHIFPRLWRVCANTIFARSSEEHRCARQSLTTRRPRAAG